MHGTTVEIKGVITACPETRIKRTYVYKLLGKTAETINLKTVGIKSNHCVF